MKKVLIIVGVVIVVAAAAGFLFWKDYQSSKLEGTVNLAGSEQPDEGRTHVQQGTIVDYKTNPPTSGNHYSEPAAWGVYDRELQDEQLVHNLEHGGIWISYQPSLSAEEKAKIEDLGRQYPQAVIVTPREKNEHPIEVASWRRRMDMNTFDRERIVDFIKRNKNQSPEPLAQ